MRRVIALAFLFVAGCGGDDTTAHIDGGDTGGDGMHADAGPCTGGLASMVDPTSGHCYVLYVNLVNYMAAKTACQQMAGVHLAKIESANEQSLITTLVGLDIAWIGGNDLVTEGTYRWDDGTPIVTTYWKSGEPDNGGGTAEEDCIGLDGARSGGWLDAPCMMESGTSVPYTYAYVCERD